MSLKLHNLKRRFTFFKKLGIFDELPRGFRVKRATTPREYRDAFTLIYDRYLAKGYIPANPYGMRIRKYDTNPDSILCVVYENDEIRGTMALIPDLPGCGIPADQIFPGEIAALRKRFSLLAEYTGMALCKQKKSRSIVMEMIRCLLWHSYKSGTQAGLMMISRAHKPFFSFFGCEQIGETRNACPGGDDPVILMYWNPVTMLSKWNTKEFHCEEWENFLKQYLIERNPYKQEYEQWEQEVKNLFSTPERLSDIPGLIPVNIDQNSGKHDKHLPLKDEADSELRSTGKAIKNIEEERMHETGYKRN